MPYDEFYVGQEDPHLYQEQSLVHHCQYISLAENLLTPGIKQGVTSLKSRNYLQARQSSLHPNL